MPFRKHSLRALRIQNEASSPSHHALFPSPIQHRYSIQVRLERRRTQRAREDIMPFYHQYHSSNSTTSMPTAPSTPLPDSATITASAPDLSGAITALREMGSYFSPSPSDYEDDGDDDKANDEEGEEVDDTTSNASSSNGRSSARAAGSHAGVRAEPSFRIRICPGPERRVKIVSQHVEHPEGMVAEICQEICNAVDDFSVWRGRDRDKLQPQPQSQSQAQNRSRGDLDGVREKAASAPSSPSAPFSFDAEVVRKSRDRLLLPRPLDLRRAKRGRSAFASESAPPGASWPINPQNVTFRSFEPDDLAKGVKVPSQAREQELWFNSLYWASRPRTMPDACGPLRAWREVEGWNWRGCSERKEGRRRSSVPGGRA